MVVTVSRLVFYTEPGLLWQVAMVVVFYASLVLTKVVVEVECDHLDEVNTHLMYLELKQAV